ncbi:MAG: hypothetical protein WKF58_01025 [Ilumatobacteraceae bacterium]
MRPATCCTSPALRGTVPLRPSTPPRLRSASCGAAATDQITDFFGAFADRLADGALMEGVREANAADVDRARTAGRHTARLVLTSAMRADMVEGLRMWAAAGGDRSGEVRRYDHDGWSLTARRAPLGVVGFVFEGRPNVFADAAGVVRSGNTAVLRIGSDALGTRAPSSATPSHRRSRASDCRAARSPSSTIRRGRRAGRCSPTGGWRSPSHAVRARRWRNSVPSVVSPGWP